MDIDIDLQINRKYKIMDSIRNYYESFGGTVLNCATFTTIGSKAAIQTAGRGLKLNNIDMVAISAMIPVERGFTWSISDCYYGNKKKERKPIKEFIREIDKYEEEGLLELSLMIEGLIINRSTHASGVFIFNEKFTDYNAIMKSPDGTLTSQFDLHDSEALGLIKYDFLLTDAASKIRLTLDLLIRDGFIEAKPTLRETYMSVLDPHKLPYDIPEIWKYIANNEVTDLFQFNTPIAMQTVSKIKPNSLVELAQANSLMRLMPKGLPEAPIDTYVRFKNDINEWYKELEEWKVPKEYVPILEGIMLTYKGVLDTQEGIMIASKHPELTNFTTGEANLLRKAVAKKDPIVMGKVENLFYEKGAAINCPKQVLDYIWKVQIHRQLMYSFSILHTIAYTFIALQELVLYHYHPSIYWQTACMTVNAGAIENDTDIEERSKSTNYGKIAKAIGDIQMTGVKVVPPYINSAGFSFEPNVANNQIVFSLKGINGIGDDVAHAIIQNAPYTSFFDFYTRMVLTGIVGTTKVITLIKAGCFDDLVKTATREQLMAMFIQEICEPKKKLTTANLQFILEYNLLPEELNIHSMYYLFKKNVFSQKNYYCQDETYKSKKWYLMNMGQQTFFEEHFISELEEGIHYRYADRGMIVCDKEFEKVLKVKSKDLYTWLETEEALNRVNQMLFNLKWNQYCQGNISRWEMESISFYYHEHELAHVNNEKYCIRDYNTLPESPKVVGSYFRKGIEFNIYQIDRIAGVVLDRDKTKKTVSLLTTTGVVTLKFNDGQFNFYDKSITKNVNGKNTVIEKGWFSRGTLLAVTGYRFGETFRVKKNSDTVYQHSVQKILCVNQDGTIETQGERAS